MPPDDVSAIDFSQYKKMHEPLENSATVKNVSSASQLLRIIQLPPFNDATWAFRGQANSCWPLKASIERVSTKPGLAEDYVEHEFKRRAHHYLKDLPNDDVLEWLALMQHHGAPTRLLDWTKSAYVAAFFAAECAQPKKSFAIWAVNRASIRTEALAMLEINSLGDGANLASRENFTRIYLTVPIEPYRMNERMTIQQDLFLCANNPLMGFDRCLKRLLDYAQERNKPSSRWLHKLVVKSETRLDVLRTLNKMNINRATLFPGLDGFAQSLRTNTEILDGDGFTTPDG